MAWTRSSTGPGLPPICEPSSGSPMGPSCWEASGDWSRSRATTPCSRPMRSSGACAPILTAGCSWWLGVGACGRLLGWREDVPRLHATFDLFVLTSRSEGTSVSLLEAMSAGLCPVVTDVGGNREVLGPGLAHRLAPPDDVRAIAESWAEAVQDRERLAQDAAAGRRQVEEHFSLRAMVRGYERIYLEGVGRSDRASPGGAIAGEAKQSQS